METQIKRFAAICEKYYEAAEETKAFEEFTVIGELFADYSVEITANALMVRLPKSEESGSLLRKIEFRKADIRLPHDLKDSEFLIACAMLEGEFGPVTNKWRSKTDEAKAALKARLQSEINERKKELEAL
jgi:hypothetical protein